MKIEDMKIEYANLPDPPEWRINALAYALCLQMQEYYKNPENVKKLEEWKVRQGEKPTHSVPTIYSNIPVYKGSTLCQVK